jgi:hypothetical protein
VGGERLAAEAGVEVDAEHDRPDVQQALAEQSEAEDQEQTGDRRAADGRPAAVVHQRRAQREQAGVDAACADAADPDVVGQQGVAGGQDLDQPAQGRAGSVDEEPERDEGRGVGTRDAQDGAVRRRSHGSLPCGWSIRFRLHMGGADRLRQPALHFTRSPPTSVAARMTMDFMRRLLDVPGAELS